MSSATYRTHIHNNYLEQIEMAGAPNAAYLVPPGESFSNPIIAGIALADAAVLSGAALNIERSIMFEISNKTYRKLNLIDFHMDCGTIIAPSTVDPYKSAAGHAKTQFAVDGIKGVMVYQWGDSYNEKICLFFHNSVRGVNNSNIKYHWDDWKTVHWYYCDITITMGNQQMSATINNCVTLKSYISDGIHAGGAFVLEA